MRLTKIKVLLTGIFITLLTVSSFAQVRSDATPTQRLDILNQKLEAMRSSLKISVNKLEETADKDDKKNPESSLGRLVSLEKEASTMQNEVNTIRGKLSRSEKYEIGDIQRIEETVRSLQTRVDNALLSSADARSAQNTDEGKPYKKKKKKKFLGIFGGGGNDEYEDLIGTVTPGRDRVLFITATREVRKGNYDVGRLLFQNIISTYPDSPYLAMAKLAVADTFFLEGGTSSLIQASSQYQDWLTFFPTHPLADRVLLKIAESEMRQIGLPDRDITRAKKAEQRLRGLIQQYPKTVLLPEAQIRLKEVQDNLGMHDLIVGNYYYKQSVDYEKGGLKGAQNRFLEILDKYPNFSFLDEALYKLAVTYQIEEETDQAAKYYQQIVRDYPNSDYVEKAKEQLQLFGANIPEPNPERAHLLPPEKKSFITNFKNEFLGIYPLTIDKDGVLMTKDFKEEKFELIDQIIENQGEIRDSQIPKSLTTVISERKPEEGK
ncbi:MAG: outer membrane protein assembly factor BamD [Aridibacter sp.]|nr:outer membrane protein assembly factor BamD [Acidobacteriota bacterium]